MYSKYSLKAELFQRGDCELKILKQTSNVWGEKNLSVSISCSFNPKIKIDSTEEKILKLSKLT